MTGNRILVGLGTIVFFFLVFHSALQIPFALHNDLGAFTYDNKHHFLGWPEGSNLFTIGRALNAVIAWCYFYFIDGIPDFATGRALSVLALAITAFCGNLWLRRLGLDAVVSFAVSSSIFLLPAAQLAVVWQTLFVPLIAPLFSLLPAGYLIYSNVSTTGDKEKKTHIVGFSIALMLTVTSFFIYQPAPFLLLLPPFAAVLFSPQANRKETRRLVVRGVLLLFVSSLLYYALQKLVIGPLTASLTPVNIKFAYSLAFTDSLFDNIRLIFSLGGLFAFNLWNIHLSRWLAAGVLLVISAGASVEILRLFFRRDMTRIEKALLATEYAVTVLGLLIFVNAPNIAASSPTISYRTLFCFTAMTGLLFFWAVFRIGSLLSDSLKFSFISVASLSLLVLAAFLAQTNVINVSMNANRELDYYRLKHDPRKLERSLSVLEARRGVDNVETVKPELFIHPLNNLSRTYLPFEFGVWLNEDEVLALIEREKSVGENLNSFAKYKKMGDSYRDSGEYARAVEMYTSALKQRHLRVEESEIFFAMAGAYLEMDNENAAVTYYEAVLAREPWNIETLNRLGIIFAGKGDTGKAARYYKTALKILPFYSATHFNLGNLYVQMGLPQLAIQEYGTILSGEPDHPETNYEMGRVYFDQGDINKALHYFNQALANNLDTADVYLARGKTFLLAGRQNLAATDFERACQKGSSEACEERSKLEGR